MNTEVLQPPKLSPARLLLLGAASVVLCLSYLMAVFTPFPVAMATVLYGRARGYLVVLTGGVVCLASGRFLTGDYTLVVCYAIMALFGVMIAETLLRGWRPVRAMLVCGLVTIGLAGAALGYSLSVTGLTAQQYATQEVSGVVARLEEARAEGKFTQDLIDLGLARPPAEIATDILRLIPGYLFIGTYFVLWVNMFLALKGRRLLHSGTPVPHDERALLTMKVPFEGVYLVVLGLVLVVLAEQIPWGLSEAAGMTLLRMLGVFYFFQGFGVMLDYLNHFSVVGFFRSLLVMGVVLLAPVLVAAVGLFDTWFDFVSKLPKKTN